MKKLILLLMVCFILTGCSLIPRVNFDTPNTVPQSVDKSKAKDVCKGQATFNKNGDITSCSKGYSSFAQNYVKEERKFTFVERIKNYINGFVGFGFWGLVLVIILCPSLLGLIVGRVFNSANSVVDQLVKSIGKFRKRSTSKEELDDILREETNNKTKKIIAQKRVTL